MVSAALPPSQYGGYVGVTRFVYNVHVQRPNAIFLLRDLVLAMVCVKKNFPLVYSSLRRARTRHGHKITARRSTVCCQEKWSGKYLTYRTGGYGPESSSYYRVSCNCDVCSYVYIVVGIIFLGDHLQESQLKLIPESDIHFKFLNCTQCGERESMCTH